MRSIEWWYVHKFSRINPTDPSSLQAVRKLAPTRSNTPKFTPRSQTKALRSDWSDFAPKVERTCYTNLFTFAACLLRRKRSSCVRTNFDDHRFSRFRLIARKYKVNMHSIADRRLVSVYLCSSSSKQAVGGRPPHMPPPLSSLCGRRGASRRWADCTCRVQTATLQ